MLVKQKKTYFSYKDEHNFYVAHSLVSTIFSSTLNTFYFTHSANKYKCIEQNKNCVVSPNIYLFLKTDPGPNINYVVKIKI